MEVDFKAMQKELGSALDKVDEIIRDEDFEISENVDGSIEHAEKLNDLEINQILGLSESVKDQLLEVFAESYFLLRSFTNLIED